MVGHPLQRAVGEDEIGASRRPPARDIDLLERDAGQAPPRLGEHAAWELSRPMISASGNRSTKQPRAGPRPAAEIDDAAAGSPQSCAMRSRAGHARSASKRRKSSASHCWDNAGAHSFLRRKSACGMSSSLVRPFRAPLGARTTMASQSSGFVARRADRSLIAGARSQEVASKTSLQLHRSVKPLQCTRGHRGSGRTARLKPPPAR